MDRVIKRHNNKLLRKDPEPLECICEPDSCPVQGKCKEAGVIYKATVKSQNHQDFTYIGLTEETFRERLRKHESNFRTRNRKNKTKLSEKIWELEDNLEDYELKWEIMTRAKPYHSGSDDCQLCLTEIYYILYHPEQAHLNSRNEFMN